MPVYIKLDPDKRVLLNDLPAKTYEDISKRLGVSWREIAAAPFENLGVARALWEEVARREGWPEDKIRGFSDEVTIEALVDVYEFVIEEDDDLPTEYKDGVPPKADEK